MIQIHVGEGEYRESFDVHEALITARSIFFKNALSGNWKEAQERVVNLPEDDPAIFAIYVHSIYNGELPTTPDSETLNLSPDWENRGICKFYVLAEKLQDIGAKNSAIDALIARSKVKDDHGVGRAPAPGSVKVIYNGTTAGSSARKLLVDFYAHRASLSYMAEAEAELPEDFKHDLLIKMFALRKPGLEDPTRATNTEYHEKNNNTG